MGSVQLSAYKKSIFTYTNVYTGSLQLLGKIVHVLVKEAARIWSALITGDSRGVTRIAQRPLSRTKTRMGRGEINLHMSREPLVSLLRVMAAA